MYAYEPIPVALTELEAKHVLGSQTQLWTEYVSTTEHAEYMLFPRLCAFSEVVWSPRDRRDFGHFRDRLEDHRDRLKAQGLNYRPLDPK